MRPNSDTAKMTSPASAAGSKPAPQTPFLNHWAAWAFAGSALAYVVGYLEAALYLRGLGLTVAPSEVYTTERMLVAGLALLAQSSVWPLMYFYLGRLQEWLNKPRLLPLLLLLVSAPAPWLVDKALSAALSQAMPLTPLATLPINAEFFIIASIFLAALLGFTLLGRSWQRGSARRSTRALLAIIGALWLILMTWGSAVRARYDVTGGFATFWGQYPGLCGILLSTAPVGPASKPVGDSGRFSTPVVLLSHHDGAYHTASRIDTLERYAIVSVVPDERVVAFVGVCSFEAGTRQWDAAEDSLPTGTTTKTAR
jgi:hypothetical protein